MTPVQPPIIPLPQTPTEGTHERLWRVFGALRPDQLTALTDLAGELLSPSAGGNLYDSVLRAAAADVRVLTGLLKLGEGVALSKEE